MAHFLSWCVCRFAKFVNGESHIHGDELDRYINVGDAEFTEDEEDEDY
jgi:hypothetical protein